MISLEQTLCYGSREVAFLRVRHLLLIADAAWTPNRRLLESYSAVPDLSAPYSLRWVLDAASFTL
jgi:hypothetical protein